MQSNAIVKNRRRLRFAGHKKKAGEMPRRMCDCLLFVLLFWLFKSIYLGNEIISIFFCFLVGLKFLYGIPRNFISAKVQNNILCAISVVNPENNIWFAVSL